jgi:hypothetical protein
MNSREHGLTQETAAPPLSGCYKSQSSWFEGYKLSAQVDFASLLDSKAISCNYSAANNLWKIFGGNYFI